MNGHPAHRAIRARELNWREYFGPFFLNYLKYFAISARREILGSHCGAASTSLRLLSIAQDTSEQASYCLFRLFCKNAGMKGDKASWVSFFQWLRGRSLDVVKLVVGNKCLGMLEAVGEVVQEAKYQRCTVHFYRNVFRMGKKSNEMSALQRRLPEPQFMPAGG